MMPYIKSRVKRIFNNYFRVTIYEIWDSFERIRIKLKKNEKFDLDAVDSEANRSKKNTFADYPILKIVKLIYFVRIVRS